MRLGRIGAVLTALVVGLALGAPADAYEYKPPWGYAFIDDHPFNDPTTGLLGPSTQVFPRGQIRDTVQDGNDVRLTVFTFTPGDSHSQATEWADEGDFVMTPFSWRFDIAPRQVSYIAYDFCRLRPGTNTTFECQPRLRIGRPPPPPPPPPPGSSPPKPAPTTPADRDGDGFDETKDCRDNNATVWPGAREVPGNGIDDDCAGGDQPARITAGIKNVWRATGKGARVLKLRVRDAPAGAAVEVRCLGRRCGFKRREATVAANGTADLTRLVRRRLPPGTTLEVRIIAPNTIGKVVRYEIKSGKVPDGRTLCLPPGAKKPKRCP
jgi:hypothetical protein